MERSLTTLTIPTAARRMAVIAMRTDLVGRLTRDGIEGGALVLLAGINAAIQATTPAAEARGDPAEHGQQNCRRSYL